MRPVQYFTKEQLERNKQLTPEEILTFLEEFRLLMASVQPVDESTPMTKGDDQQVAKKAPWSS